MRSRQRNIFEKCGDIFFVTSTVVGHIDIFINKSLCKIFIDNLEYYQERGDYKILAYVLMPDHFHLILKIRQDCSISQCIGNLKRITSRKISEYLINYRDCRLLDQLRMAASSENTDDSKIWKYRFDCLVINNVSTLRQKMDYTHNNPVRRGLVSSASEWPFSSANNYNGSDDGIIAVEKNCDYLTG